MRLRPHQLSPVIVAVAVLALLLHGPIAQWPDYHHFADTRTLGGLPNALDVISNLGFALVGVWGFAVLWPCRHDAAFARGWSGWCLFLAALILTAFGSAYYHLAPDDFRLAFDRIPIALACAGLLAAFAAETYPRLQPGWATAGLAILAVASVLYWYVTALAGIGDLRPYLLVQAAPLALVPLWQAQSRAPSAERIAVACAIFCYVLAKAAEVHDHQLLALLGVISGHTLKHLLATAASALLLAGVVGRLRLRSPRIVPVQ